MSNYTPYREALTDPHITVVDRVATDRAADITLIRACLRVLGAVDKKNAVLVSVALDALRRIENGGK